MYFFSDIETEYQAFLVKKEDNDKSYRDTQAELDGLMKEVESYNNQLQVILVDEKDADELVKTLPEEIKKLEEKIESASKLLLFSHDPWINECMTLFVDFPSMHVRHGILQ